VLDIKAFRIYISSPYSPMQMMLARMQSLFGQFPQRMLDTGRDSSKYLSAKGVVFERPEGADFVRCD
jgi:hypothetical protein